MPVPDLPIPGASPPCFVRFRHERPDGFVEFDFAIGVPELSVDLILPRAAYDEFCATHRVSHLSAAEAGCVDAEQARWRHGEGPTPR